MATPCLGLALPGANLGEERGENGYVQTGITWYTNNRAIVALFRALCCWWYVMPTDYSLNSRVLVHIARPIPPGLLGHLEDGQRAIIRSREISWDKLVSPQEYVGQTREAIVVGFNRSYDELELSLRLALYDPWQGIEDRYPPGIEVKGQVVGLTEKGAFVELEAGVEGFLPAAEFSPSRPQALPGGLWVRDHVRAVVTHVEPERRRLRLSIQALLTRREARFRRQLWGAHQPAESGVATLAERLPTQIRLQLLRLNADSELPAPEPVLQALVIEDDAAYGAGLRGLLQRNGCQVTRTTDGITGMVMVCDQDRPFDLILVDWNLPGLKGHDIVRQLQQEGCPSRFVVVLEPAPLDGCPEIWEELRDSGVDVLSKADTDECTAKLISILGELRSDENPPRPARVRYFPETKPLTRGEEPLPAATQEALLESRQPENMAKVLARLKREVRATTVALLRFEPGSRRLSVSCLAGEPFFADRLSPELIHSPLKDVLLEGKQVSAFVPSAPSRFDRLLELSAFEGFVGIPLLGLDAASFGLFLLRKKGGFSRQQCQKARLTGELVARILEQDRLIRVLETWQAQNLIGQISSSMIHEVTNKLGGLGYQLDVLRDGLSELARWPEKAADATFLRQFEQAIDEISSAHQQAMALRDRYLRVTAQDEPQLVDLVEVAEDALCALRPEAQQRNIVLDLRGAKELPPVRARPGQLLQIFVNLLLNAIQQMAGLGRQGNLYIELSCLPAGSCPLQVRFVDQGPGIHRRLWERVFDLGFTTKEKGAGMGLTISRQVAQDLGGTLRVEESHMLWGTTFLLELPKGA
jgi:signal transduction histidine kinase/predicted RNA-binding protein with RPS1 domain/ActR/RegA family two-component response regulator